MPEIMQVGPFMIRVSWLLWAISGFVGYAVMKYKLKRSAYSDKPVLDILSGGLVISALVWKFSPLINSPSMLWKKTLRVLFVSGTSESVWLAAAAGAAYIGFKCWRMRDSRWLLSALLPYGITSMVVTYSFLSWQYGIPTNLPWGISIENPNFKYHPLNVYRILITIPVLIWLWRRTLGDLNSGKPFGDFITFYGFGLLIISFFENQTGWVLGISREQVLYCLMVALGSILSFTRKKIHPTN